MMKACAPSPLKIAAAALSEAEENLVGLPLNEEVRDLQRRWYALRTVVHGVVVERVPSITQAQESKIMERAVSFARRSPRHGGVSYHDRPWSLHGLQRDVPGIVNADDMSNFTRMREAPFDGAAGI